MKKRFICVILTVTICLSLFACGKDKKDEQALPDTTEETTAPDTNEENTQDSDLEAEVLEEIDEMIREKVEDNGFTTLYWFLL